MLEVKEDFPILQRLVHGRRLAYLDSAASMQKPRAVVEAMVRCMQEDYSNIHRGVHYLSQQLTLAYEGVRAQVARFVNAERAEEIIFTKSTTEAINLLASSLAQWRIQAGDKILITAMEHHANIVPWQMVCERYQAQLCVLPMNARGELLVEDLEALLDGVKIFALAHVSNALGTINEVQTLVTRAREKGVLTVVDGAQAVAHMAVDVQALDCDFYVFSGHKIYGPTGVGVLYGRYALLQDMPVYQGGGDMILSVSFEHTEYAPPPTKFEAGTPPIVEVIGLGAALDWVQALGLDAIARHEQTLAESARMQLQALDGVRLIGEAKARAAVVSFTLEGIHPHDVGTILDDCGVAVRVGHHCAEPVMRFFRCLQQCGQVLPLIIMRKMYHNWCRR
ncbi:aminotransferase class V-fold PLP-dependent enzyme [Rappaport israeli]|uniref:aminotransferase class V-fold PLP-dependent enzyme n=1 Tax=Rappaport israeli TaxID=1839807 RepID=UPI000AED0BC6